MGNKMNLKQIPIISETLLCHGCYYDNEKNQRCDATKKHHKKCLDYNALGERKIWVIDRE